MDSQLFGDDIRHYISLVWRWLWLILLVSVLASAGMYFYSSRIPPVYQASASLLINEAPGTKTTDYSSIITSQRLAQTYAKVLVQKPVLREVIARLERRESPLISEALGNYFRDIYDHTIIAIDTVETYRDILSGMLDIYLSSMSNRLNQIMKVLTIIATIFMPLTFITSLYGMNFKHMPELQWEYGYYGVIGVMLVIALSMIEYFRRKHWL